MPPKTEPPDRLESSYQREDRDEGKPGFVGADRPVSAAGRARRGVDRRHLPRAWDRRDHVLSLAQAVWRHECPETQRLREVEKENARLKRLLAERDLEVDLLKELLAKKP